MAQSTAGVATNYVLDPIGLAQVLVESAGGQNQYYLPGLAQYNSSGWKYYAPDRLGSIRQMVDPTGQLALAQSFDPFGNLMPSAVPQGGFALSGLPSSFGYTGEQTDPTGLVFLRARYYNPAVGRFLTADSFISNPLRSRGWNRYGYAGNNAVNYTDPTGHWDPCFAASANECDGSLYYAGFYVNRAYAPPGYNEAIEYLWDPIHYLDPIVNHVVGGMILLPIGDLAGHLVGLYPPVVGMPSGQPSLVGLPNSIDIIGNPGPTGLNWNGIRYAHDIGVSRGQAAAVEDGFTPSGWRNPFANRGNYGQGFDEICYGPTGTPVIVEYKGGVNPQLRNGQMETPWVRYNIQRLIRAGDPMGYTLQTAFNNGTLTGAAYLTPIQSTVPQSTLRIYFTYP